MSVLDPINDEDRAFIDSRSPWSDDAIAEIGLRAKSLPTPRAMRLVRYFLRTCGGNAFKRATRVESFRSWLTDNAAYILAMHPALKKS